jgi:hypothetical protein
LTLNFICFFGVGPVWCTVQQRSTQDKLDLVLNASEWWQPRWNFTWKDISIFLQNVSHNRGQRFCISCNEIKTSLHIKA